MLPAASRAFGYPQENFKERETNLNALFYSFAYHFGLAVENEEETMKLFGRDENPCSKETLGFDFEVVGKTRVYELRTLPTKVLSERYKEYRAGGKSEAALKACAMKLNFHKLLEGRVETTTLAEIAEVLLEEGFPERAIAKAEEGLRLVNPIHATAIKFFCILMRAKYAVEKVHDADLNFERALKAL